MADVVSRDVRSRMMAGIRAKNTKPELLLRRELHARGFRYRLHDKRLAGKPDLVFPRFKAVIFVHGCFWHGHSCPLFKWPKTRQKFWRDKIEGNRARDLANEVVLLDNEWRVGSVWECALRGRTRRDTPELIDQCTAWLQSDVAQLDIAGI